MCIMYGVTEKREKIKEQDLLGFKYFKSISGMLEGLHDAGCERDKAVNRIFLCGTANGTEKYYFSVFQ